MNQTILFVYFLIISNFLNFTNCAIDDTFEIFKKNIQKIARDLAQKVQSKVDIYCSKENAQCIDKSHNQCLGYCVNTFAKTLKCGMPGAKISTNSGVKTPYPFTFTNQIKFQACGNSAKIDNLFRLSKQRYTNQIQISTELDSFIFRAFPDTNQCPVERYDPRSVKWYVARPKGAKNIIILIDASSNMTQQMLQSVKDSVISLLQTLSIHDFISIVLFSQTASIQISQFLQRATARIKDVLINTINSLSVSDSGVSNFEQAFNKVNEIFNKTVTDDYGATCQYVTNIVMLISASQPNAGKSTATQLIQSINQWNQNYNITLFTFSLKGTNSDVLRELSCAFNGQMVKSHNNYLTSQQIKVYEQHLVNTINIDDSVWPEIYDDFETENGTRMVTISTPIYLYLVNRHIIIITVILIAFILVILRVVAWRFYQRCTKPNKPTQTQTQTDTQQQRLHNSTSDSSLAPNQVQHNSKQQQKQQPQMKYQSAYSDQNIFYSPMCREQKFNVSNDRKCTKYSSKYNENSVKVKI